MKTSKIFILGFIASILVSGIVSCADRIYKIDTQINSNGSGVRKIYAKGDSAFLAGDTSHNPFLFNYMQGWQLKVIDTVTTKKIEDYKNYNVFVQKSFRSISELSDGLSFREEFRSFVVPTERLEKHFRWFYTYYTFKAAYSPFSIPLPVSIDKYMNKDEQRCWFQGDFSNYRGMSGIEYKGDLDDIEQKFKDWWLRNEYEISFNTVLHFAEQVVGNPLFSGLENVKDTLFVLNLKATNKIDSLLDTDNRIPPKLICDMLDIYYHTKDFSTFYAKNKDEINRYFEEQANLKEVPNGILLKYRLKLPGKVFSTNANRNSSDTLYWEIKGFQLYASEDYILTAESRKTNAWAFAVTFLAGFGALIFSLRKRK